MYQSIPSTTIPQANFQNITALLSLKCGIEFQKGQPPLKEEKTRHQLNFKHLIHIFFIII